MRFPLLIVAQFFVALALGAEDALPPDMAELQRRIAIAPASQKAALLTEFADQFEPVDPLRGIAPAREAMAAATNEHEKLAAQAVLASLLRYQTDYTTAKDLAQSGLQRAIALGDDRLRARFSYELGRVLWNLAEHAEALKHLHEAIRLGERLGDARLLAGAHLWAFIIWIEFDEHEHAWSHLEAERKYAEQVGDAWRLADYQRALGNYRIETNDLIGALAAHERSRDISAHAGQTRGYADSSINLSAVAESQGDLERAHTFAEEAVALYQRLGLKRYLCNAYRQLGRVLVKQKQYTNAIDALDRSLALAEGFGGRAAMANTWRQLAVAHEAAGHPEIAATYRRKLDAENTAIFGDQARQKIALLDAQFQFERSQHKLELLRRDEAVKDAELLRARVYRYGLLAIVALVAVAAAAIVSRQRMKFATERRVHEETQAARQAAEAANQLKTRLLGIASHDLKSPLATIIGCARQIEEQPNNPVVAAEFSVAMRRQGEHMLSLVRELLDLSAIESGHLNLTRATCDLAALAVARTNGYRPAAAQKKQVLTCVVPSCAVNVSADSTRLAQVFDNLIGNAIKFTPAGKSIQVMVEIIDDRAIARVRDAGPGFQPEDFGRLFQPFQTLSAQPTGGESSSGLGLYIAHQIVTLHGGALVVDSKPGEGAVFSIEMPLALSHPAARPGATARSGTPTGDQAPGVAS